MTYFHTNIEYIDIKNVYIPDEFKSDAWLLDQELTIGVNGNSDESDPIVISIDSGVFNVGNLEIELTQESAKALADGIYFILKSRENKEK
jgi:hypothetical protein